MRRIIYESEHQLVISMAGVGDTVVVSFGDLTNRPNGVRFWGDALFEKMGIPSIGFVPKSSNWFPVLDTRQAIKIVLAEITPRRYQQIICYGFSMGAYAALKYSEQLGASGVIAFSPQYSIDPNSVGSFDRRYEAMYIHSLHQGMDIKKSDKISNCAIFVDNSDYSDFRHLQYIEKLAPVDVILMSSFSHETIRLLSETGVSSEVLSTFISNPAGSYRTRLLRNIVRGARSRSKTYWWITGRRLRRLNPREVDCWTNAFLMSHRLDTTNPRALLDLSESLIQDGFGERAQCHLDELISYSSHAADRHRIIALLQKVGRVDDAIHIAEAFSADQDDGLGLQIWHARLLADRPDPTEAKNALKRLQKRHGEMPAVWEETWRLSCKLGWHADAVEALHRLIELKGDSVEVRLDLASIFIELEQKERAQVVLRVALNLVAPDSILIRLWNMLRNVGLHKEAAPYAERLVSINPSDQFIRLHLVNSYIDIGLEREAASEIKRILESDLTNAPLPKRLEILYHIWAASNRVNSLDDAREAAIRYLAYSTAAPNFAKLKLWMETSGVITPT